MSADIVLCPDCHGIMSADPMDAFIMRKPLCVHGRVWEEPPLTARDAFAMTCGQCAGHMELKRLRLPEESGASFSGECPDCGTRYTVDVEGAGA